MGKKKDDKRRERDEDDKKRKKDRDANAMLSIGASAANSSD